MDPIISPTFNQDVGKPGTPPQKPPRRQKAQKTTCSYQAPPGYDSFAPKMTAYDNFESAQEPLPPWLRYDNVSSNLLTYDNAPQRPRRRWEHECTCGKEVDTVANDAQVIAVGSFEEGQAKNQQILLPESGCYGNKVGNGPLPSASPITSPSSPGWNRSVIAETIELIERSIKGDDDDVTTVDEGHVRFSEATEATPDEESEKESERKPMAPLAIPESAEDLGGSTTEGELGLEGSADERSPPEGLGVALEGVSLAKGTTPEDAPPSAWASESKIYEIILPISEVQFVVFIF